MPADDDPLWLRLQAFEFNDAGASLTFTRRLARENGWSVGFATRVVEEYKRFVYLAMTAGHQVTPSDEVDQAWHLHLTYTRSYWDDLCREVLGRPLHHGPTKGGRAEGERFEDQYERTLASYRNAFGEAPPDAVWPPSAIRFGEAAGFVRVNRARAWVLAKPWRVAGGRPLAVAGCFLAIAPPLAAGAAWNPLDFDGPEFLRFYAALATIGVVAALVCRNVLRAPDTRDADAVPLDDSETVAAMRGSWQAVFHSALAGLITEGALSLREASGRFRSKKQHAEALRSPEPSDTELARTLLEAAAQPKATLAKLGEAAEPIARRPVEALEGHGLLETGETFNAARTVIGLIMGSVWLLGAAKLAVGIGRDKPVGFLVAGLVVLALISLFLVRRPKRTRAGERRWNRLLVDHTALKQRASDRNAYLAPNDMAMAVGLFGVAACTAPGLDPLRQAVSATSADSGGCGGDGDGGCGGGGCGGCGGCG